MSKLNSSSAISCSPLVSVAITAFNLERWLPKALDSVLEQRTSFPIEIVIGDDCSTDSTASIARAYSELHPNVVRVLERRQNLGMSRNYYETFEECRGKYIAWLDSDDYWTDPEKLAVQVEVLESDASINVCGHLVRWVDTDGAVQREIYPSLTPGRYGLAEIIHHNFLPSPSVVFRNGIQRELPPWYFDLAPTTDWPLYVIAALSGDIVLLDRVMADYRLTPGSSFMSKGNLFWYKEDARFYEHIESILPAKWQRLARVEKGKRYESMAYVLRAQGDFSASREAALKAFCATFFVDNIGSKSKMLLSSLMRETEWRFRGGRRDNNR
jgi:glycosyltransferase involved in cell wall biosynthesis